jgi:hypothetical protein
LLIIIFKTGLFLLASLLQQIIEEDNELANNRRFFQKNALNQIKDIEHLLKEQRKDVIPSKKSNEEDIANKKEVAAAVFADIFLKVF